MQFMQTAGLVSRLVYIHSDIRVPDFLILLRGGASLIEAIGRFHQCIPAFPVVVKWMTHVTASVTLILVEL